MAAVRGNGAPRGLAGFAMLADLGIHDFFSGTTLNSAWSVYGSTPTTAVAGGVLTLTTSSNGQGIVRSPTTSIPNVASVWCRIKTNNNVHSMTGIFFHDGSSAGVGGSTYDTSFNTYSWNLSSAKAYLATGTSTGYVATDMWLKLRRNGTSYFVSAASHDVTKDYRNQAYGTETSALTWGGIPSQIGIGSFFANAIVGVEEFHYLPS